MAIRRRLLRGARETPDLWNGPRAVAAIKLLIDNNLVAHSGSSAVERSLPKKGARQSNRKRK
jgi:hypothetical protein